MGTFTLSQVHFTSLLWATLLSLLYLKTIQVKNTSIYSKRTIYFSFYSQMLFKGMIKPVGKPVNRFVNQFELFV